ncbi:nucleoside triphosphate pyrophosphohydrolase [Companilactobacillus ginsenosidimutans]|uniref:Nucleotide pyrophosphohydrolase n=1 Tax=Companilactobacillus ginsenosidimutans TaxID=1007676 RepID=A0A0H4QIL8_9LACO|nr:nucleoside triphosphate pyrophosphohydrolase [Companilactobacillus ginsenosidimutans]AKP67787.1 nucleotide pyrophosphohydrolase [Companilactobacillus ginsenosidimutans]
MFKLVRNKIPDIVGDEVEFTTLTNEDYRIALRTKLVEEANKVKKAETRANLVEELGDLEEIIHAILEDASITYEEMDSIRHSKDIQRGNFSDKIAMTTTD